MKREFTIETYMAFGCARIVTVTDKTNGDSFRENIGWAWAYQNLRKAFSDKGIELLGNAWEPHKHIDAKTTFSVYSNNLTTKIN